MGDALCCYFLYFIKCVSSFAVIWMRNKKQRPKATANTRTSLFLKPLWREWAAAAVLSCLVLVSSEKLTGLRGETGAGGFSRGRPSRLCSFSALTRKARALRGKTAGAKRLHTGTKKWGRTPRRPWSSRAPRRCRKQSGSCWRAHMLSSHLTDQIQGTEDVREMTVNLNKRWDAKFLYIICGVL